MRNIESVFRLDIIIYICDLSEMKEIRGISFFFFFVRIRDTRNGRNCLKCDYRMNNETFMTNSLRGENIL